MAENTEEQKGKELARRGQLTKEEERERERAIRAKKAEGETLTREEAGMLGAVASRRATAEEEERAVRAGLTKEFEEEHKVETWTSAPEKARKPHVTAGAKEEEARIRGKQERGETLTRHEAGVLGGIARARETGEEE